MAKNIYDYVLNEKVNYESGRGVSVAGNWHWSMFTHNNYTMLMKNSQFPNSQLELGKQPFKNIILPIIKVAHRTEDFDVKDIQPYVDNSDNFHLSFLARKFYYNWAIENKLDTFIDEVVEALDYGFVLVKNVNSKRPEVVQPQQIAFVDQTDILSGTIALKHQYSIDQLVTTGEELGWDKDKIDVAVMNAREEKTNQDSSVENQTPDKHIEVFEVEGTFPESWLLKDDENYNKDLKADKYSLQVHIISYVKDDKGNKKGICLYKGRRDKTIFKVLITDPVYGRACGRGRVEELFEPQVWTNFTEINMMNMLKNASKTIHITTDKSFNTNNNTKNAKDNEVWTMDEGKTFQQANMQPVNFQLFFQASEKLEQHARTLGSASDPALGLAPVSGTPLGTTQVITQQGEGDHEKRRGKIASFIHEIHIDWILDYLVEDMNKGLEWADDLSLDEMQKFAQDVMTNSFNRYIIDSMLKLGKFPTEEELAPLREQFKQEFMKSSTKFLKILKDEFKGLPLRLKFNVAGKQKDLSKMTEKLTNIWRTIFANPQGFIATMQIPGASKAFNEMLEYSGMNQFDFSTMPAPTQPLQPQQGNGIISPMQPIPQPTQ